MVRLLLALLLFGAIMTAVKIAIIVLILAGLIFRTKETLGILLLLCAWQAFKLHPLLAAIPVAILLIFGTYKALTEPT